MAQIKDYYILSPPHYESLLQSELLLIFKPLDAYYQLIYDILNSDSYDFQAVSKDAIDFIRADAREYWISDEKYDEIERMS